MLNQGCLNFKYIQVEGFLHDRIDCDTSYQSNRLNFYEFSWDFTSNTTLFLFSILPTETTVAGGVINFFGNKRIHARVEMQISSLETILPIILGKNEKGVKGRASESEQQERKREGR